MLGHWHLEGRLGSGGMGVVYLVTAPDGTRAALKLVRADLADDPMFRARFKREVDAVARVRGERVARLIEADPEAQQPYLVVEFVDGPTLNQTVTEAGPMRGDRLLAFAAALAEAVVSIHQAGVVHRDLKPSNVLLTADAPKVVDFGVASASEATAITQAGVVLGSPGWMAPEQLTGGATTPAIDVFTWASLVVYAATGQPPFGEGRPEAIAYRIVHQTPELSGVEPPLRGLVAQAFTTEPAQRPSMVELLGRLVHQQSDDPSVLAAETTRLLAGGWRMPSVLWVPVPPTPAYPRPAAGSGSRPPAASPPTSSGASGRGIGAPGRRWPWVLAGFALVAALAGGALAWWLGDEDDGTATPQVTTTTAAPTTTTLPPIGDVIVAMTVRDNADRVVEEPCESEPPYDDISWRFDDPENGDRLAYSATVDEGTALPGDSGLGDFFEDLLGVEEAPTYCRYEAVIPAVPDRDAYVLVSSITGDDTDEVTYSQDDLEDARLQIELTVAP
jgi:hypothetical protein